MGKSLMFDARSRMPVPASELFAWHAREGALERLTPPWEPVGGGGAQRRWHPRGRPGGDADAGGARCRGRWVARHTQVHRGLALPGRAGVRPLRALGAHPPVLARAAVLLGAGGRGRVRAAAGSGGAGLRRRDDPAPAGADVRVPARGDARGSAAARGLRGAGAAHGGGDGSHGAGGQRAGALPHHGGTSGAAAGARARGRGARGRGLEPGQGRDRHRGAGGRGRGGAPGGRERGPALDARGPRSSSSAAGPRARACCARRSPGSRRSPGCWCARRPSASTATGETRW